MSSNAGIHTELLQFLEQRDSYPHRPDDVRHIQTHISHVFIVAPYVYKLKKPVDFGFLDYSTLDKRQKFCQKELQLNRRLTEDVYLDVVAITKRDGRYAFESADQVTNADSVVEYAVKMRKLEDQYFLHTYIENDTLTDHHLERVADKLARFYNRQQPDDEIAQWGSIENIKVNTDENFEQTQSFIAETIQRRSFEAIQTYTNTYFERNRSLFQQRQEAGCIIDGHGDLHLEHIHITPDEVMIYDCIEFNDRFRYGDYAVDLAFLAMDLDFNHCRSKERYFVNRMAAKLDDDDLIRIIDFYKCYRAYVKGKVKSLQSAEEEVPRDKRTEAAELASRYFNLSLYYALLGSDPKVLIFMGRVGTGKSTLSKQLADTLNIERFSSDQIRKTTAGQPLRERTPASKRDQLYSKQQSEQVYAMLREQAMIDAGSIVLDATFSNQTERQQLTAKLESAGIGYVFIEAQAPDATIKERLKTRETDTEVISDARLEDFDTLNNAYDPPSEVPDQHLVQVRTDQTVEESLKELYDKLIALNLA